MVPELENPIFPAFAQVIESTLAQHGYTPVLWGLAAIMLIAAMGFAAAAVLSTRQS